MARRAVKDYGLAQGGAVGMAGRKVGRAEELGVQILAVARRDGLKPGDRLVEQRLAESLGLSRGPVRSGLAALARSGLASAAPQRGYVLADGAESAVLASALTAAAGGERHYRAIADDRLDGRLPATVTEAELMRRYGLKRPDLLRLLDRIAAEGWVERLPGYGWRFAEILTSAASYAQSARFRAVIEPAAILEPGFRLAPEVIERLREQQQRVLAGGPATLTIGEIFQFGCELHEEIARGASNPFFVEALRRVNAIRRLFTYRLLTDHDRIARHIRDHLRLLDLIAAGCTADAAALMRRHLRQVPQTTR
jgi:DNA-binding GntR family transcriptional regulator